MSIWDMEEKVRNMIGLSIETYIEGDVDKAYEAVREGCDRMDGDSRTVNNRKSTGNCSACVSCGRSPVCRTGWLLLSV